MVEEDIAAAVAVEVSDPEGPPVVDRMTKPSGVANIGPLQLVTCIETTELPVVGTRIIKQELVAIVPRETPDPEGPPVVDRMTKPSPRVANIGPLQLVSRIETTEHP